MNDFELNDMRQQMDMLKKKLEQQEIVNDRIIRQSMRKDVAYINRTYTWTSVLALMMIPYCYWAFVVLAGFSIAFWVATSLFMLAAVGYTYYNGKDMFDSHLMNENLVEVHKKVARAKKRDSQWLLISIPVLILWIAWFAYEIYLKGGSREVIGFAYGGTVGGIIGLIIGLRIHFKTQRKYREIIEQIEEVTETE